MDQRKQKEWLNSLTPSTCDPIRAQTQGLECGRGNNGNLLYHCCKICLQLSAGDDPGLPDGLQRSHKAGSGSLQSSRKFVRSVAVFAVVTVV